MGAMTKQQRGTVMMKCVECDGTVSAEFELPGPQMVQPHHRPNCPSIDLEFQPRYRIWAGVASDENARPLQRFAGHHPDREGARLMAEMAAEQAGYDPGSATNESYTHLRTTSEFGDANGWLQASGSVSSWRYEAEYHLPK